MTDSERKYMDPNIGRWGHEVSGTRLLSREDCDRILDNAPGRRRYFDKIREFLDVHPIRYLASKLLK